MGEGQGMRVVMAKLLSKLTILTSHTLTPAPLPKLKNILREGRKAETSASLKTEKHFRRGEKQKPLPFPKLKNISTS
jgi:hypothetical protein